MPSAYIRASFRFVYEPLPEHVSDARRQVAAICDAHDFDPFGPALAVSELLTNALKFGSSDDHLTVAAHVDRTSLTVEVTDPAVGTVPDLDGITHPADDSESSRGLLLVREVCDRVEVTRRTPDQKALSARFTRTDRELACYAAPQAKRPPNPTTPANPGRPPRDPKKPDKNPPMPPNPPAPRRSS
ncbi:ATP-binding protein [Yinghuangia soli]|uniref:ATP-binding protein n=1 Tax=Yinghuangia soli TaxID=2908204 RepID=A0AA41U1S5_9ACTN|nr:ATP-binding protein [Yinghuangia soli]MCF2527867.1 ATP-binding protein [Yinghuangia soli]